MQLFLHIHFFFCFYSIYLRTILGNYLFGLISVFFVFHFCSKSSNSFVHQILLTNLVYCTINLFRILDLQLILKRIKRLLKFSFVYLSKKFFSCVYFYLSIKKIFVITNLAFTGFLGLYCFTVFLSFFSY